jgi:hypothetical protein
MSTSTSLKLLALGLLVQAALAGCAGAKESPRSLDGSIECAAESDCPPDAPGTWNACVGPAGDCTQEGTQARSVLAFTCEHGTCRAHERIEQRACARATEGLPCHDAGTLVDAGSPALDAPTAARAAVPRPVPGSAPTRSSCANAGAACSTGNACELGEIQCIDRQPQCVAVSVATREEVCRPASGPCDLEERCDGTSGACPEDAFASPASVCRPAAGPCDRDETCTGTGPACPADAYLAPGTECRPGASACDVHEVCTGSSAICPADDAGCAEGAYCLIDTCHAQPSIHVQGDDGSTCSDLARGNDQPLLRITFRGRPHAPFRYWQRHLSCAGAGFEEHAAVACDEGTVGRLDATGTCTYTVRDRITGDTCPDPRVGRWELSVEVDGQRSPSAFIDFHHSAPTCPGNPRTCTAAATYCPPTGGASAHASQRTARTEELP